ncbi:MAG: IS200/IS605 family transposase [Lewinellaceae bacterium]|nr:IS200/IS605 family transposase [Lewinellaceae bacterium]
MPHSIAPVYLHTVFSTKYKKHLITPAIEQKLYKQIGGIIHKLRGIPIEINGMPDHIHILSTLPRTVTIAKYIEEIKKGSSKWIKTQGPEFQYFAWQGGYATFSVSHYKVDTVAGYIKKQKGHHKRKSFEKELIQYLEENQIVYDEKYLWD